MRILIKSLIFTVFIFVGCSDSGNIKKIETSSTTDTDSQKIKVTQNVIKNMEVNNSNSKSNSGQFYYTYNKEKNSTKIDEKKVRTTLDAYLNIRSPYERIRVELMIKKLSKDFIINCSPCHDDYANGVIGPSLLGKDGDYIYKKIMEFKGGQKRNVLMKELIAKMDNKQLKSIAEEIAKFNKEIQEFRKDKK